MCTLGCQIKFIISFDANQLGLIMKSLKKEGKPLNLP